MTNIDMMVNIVIALLGVVFGSVSVIVYKSKSKVNLKKRSSKDFDNLEMQSNPIKQYKK